MRSGIRVAVLTAALLGQAVVASPALADSHPRVETVAEGLTNPRGLDVAADGTIYVAEAGLAGDAHCATRGEGEEQTEICMGASSGVAAVAPDGTVTEAVSDLPSLMLSENEFVGAADVAVAEDGGLYVAVGLGGSNELRDGAAADWEPAAMFGTVRHYAEGVGTEVADLAAWEAENDPNAGQPSTSGEQGTPSNDSNPNSLIVTADGALVAVDAGGNSVLEVDPADGDIQLRGFFPDRMVDAPPFLGLPEGTQMPMQSVPTSVVEHPDTSTLVVGELTGFPFPVGGARVYELDDAGDTSPAVLAEGFTNIMDVAYLNGELYVLEIAHNSLLAGPQGALVRVRADGTRIALLRDVLVAPGGLEVGPDGLLYITNNSLAGADAGTVLRFDPALAADPTIQSACPPLVVPGTSLTDVADTTHEEAITCTDWYGIFSGYADDTFRPAGDITRGQLATTVAGLIRATDAALPTGDPGQFTDVDGTTHAPAVNDLAAAGIVDGYADDTFRPALPVTRAQATSVLVAAYEFVTGDDVPAGADAFDDDNGGAHEANTNAAAAMGWVHGVSEATFVPGGDLRRGQTARMLARVAADLVDAEHLTLPN